MRRGRRPMLSILGWPQEETQGRHWTCPDRSVAGFPFAIDMRCDRPKFTGRLYADKAEMSLGGLNIRTTLLDPFHAEFKLTPPFTYRGNDGQSASTMTWTTLHGVLGGLPRQVSTISLSGTGLSAVGVSSPRDPDRCPRGHDGSPRARRHQDAKKNATKKVLEFKIAMSGAKVPALDAVLGGVANTDLAFSGK